MSFNCFGWEDKMIWWPHVTIPHERVIYGQDRHAVEADRETKIRDDSTRDNRRDAEDKVQDRSVDEFKTLSRDVEVSKTVDLSKNPEKFQPCPQTLNCQKF